MSEDQALALTGTLGAMVLVLGSLTRCALPLRMIWRWALVWVAIFVGLFLLTHLFPQAMFPYFT